jgi:hypothetical protein
MTDTDLPAPGAERYLGDGLYVSFDGFHIVLRAPRTSGDHFVALEPSVYSALKEWLAAYPALRKHMGDTP